MSSKLIRLFGRNLIKCDDDQLAKKYETGDALAGSDVIGVYFTFANVYDEFVKRLKDLYQTLRAANNDSHRGRLLEVVEVVMWANNDVYDSISDFENSHRDCLLGLPWFALPYSETELKTRLSRRYRIKSGVPTLVLLDRDGNTISSSAQDRLLEDPLGTGFPWRPRPVDQVLNDIVLQTGGTYQKEHQHQNVCEITYADLPDGIRGFYFSANWCPPCRAFTPQLAEIYATLRKREPAFEIIFISSDRSPESYAAALETMPWLAVPYQQTSIRAELAQLYGIRGIPTLLLLDNNGHVITMDARAELADDPMAQNFPWKPRAVNILTGRFATKLHDYPAIVFFIDGEDTEIQFAESVLTPAANAYYKRHNINFNNTPQEDLLLDEDDRYLQFLIGIDSDTSDILRDLIGLEDVAPLLVGVDLPNRRYVVMEYGVEITVESVSDFVEKFQKGDLQFQRLADSMSENTDV